MSVCCSVPHQRREAVTNGLQLLIIYFDVTFLILGPGSSLHCPSFTCISCVTAKELGFDLQFHCIPACGDRPTFLPFKSCTLRALAGIRCLPASLALAVPLGLRNCCSSSLLLAEAGFALLEMCSLIFTCFGCILFLSSHQDVLSLCCGTAA